MESMMSASDTTGGTLLSSYSGLYAPVDGAFTQLARMAALVLDAPIVSVNIAQDARLWFPDNEGPADGGSLHGPSPSANLGLVDGPSDGSADAPAAYAVEDASRDPRTREHPWVADGGIRFLAVAAIRIPAGTHVGTLEVLDRRRHRHVTGRQLELLGGLAATVAQLLNLRVGALRTLRAARAEHAADSRRRDDAERETAQRSQAATAARDRRRPEWCQLGGTVSCRKRAELKVADSSGDSAWGCWEHAEDALIQVPSVFLTMDTSSDGLQAYRNRTSRPGGG